MFTACDTKTGKELRSCHTGSGIVGSPIAFSIGGKRYIAVLSGWGGKGGAPHSQEKFAEDALDHRYKGEKQTGYSVAEEAPVFLVFAVPAVAALVAWCKLR